ncbi:unnamed protein product [Brassica oleracea]
MCCTNGSCFFLDIHKPIKNTWEGSEENRLRISILILELLTGRRLVEYGEDSFVILSDHVRVLLEQGNVLKCIDPTMEEEYSEDEVLPFLKLVLVCTSQIPSNLPTMAKIVQILQAISSSVPHYHRMLDSFSKSSVLI